MTGVSSKFTYAVTCRQKGHQIVESVMVSHLNDGARVDYIAD